ncbi:hypothetical protein TNIN_340691 [Trichonephila inaurata madagascariensis]|uniref:Uncharacterized protein n=1 Tax=Trichonephila inaurata madagascariensis TaxID=2747483 RepID=A0A8X6I7Q6_9ARAC|nr:hypothetical protein TNIN_340691 [Trichonephila inaurata madagascariensis]
MVFTTPMLSLRQLALLKVATLVCDDTKIKNFLRKHGSVSFVFSKKEALIFMDLTEAGDEQGWIREDRTPINGLKDFSHSLHPFNADPKFIQKVEIVTFCLL